MFWSRLQAPPGLELAIGGSPLREMGITRDQGSHSKGLGPPLQTHLPVSYKPMAVRSCSSHPILHNLQLARSSALQWFILQQHSKPAHGRQTHTSRMFLGAEPPNIAARNRPEDAKHSTAPPISSPSANGRWLDVASIVWTLATALPSVVSPSASKASHGVQ